jgi:hypothetical protein
MATYGHTFTSGDTLTPTKLNAARTATDIVNADIAAAAAIAGTKLASDSITNTQINASAAIALSKLATGALPTAITVASANLVDGTIVNADINASAAIADTKLATISTAGKVSNSATTATNANTANAIVARDASGNFSAGTITAALTGTASAIADGSVSTAKIVDANVTNAKLASDIDASKLTTGTLPIARIADAAVTPTKLSQPLTLATAQATTSGTSIDFTGIPSWVKRITVLLNRVSTNGTSNYLVQLGSGTLKTSGYVSTATSGAAGVTTITETSGHIVAAGAAAASQFNGHLVLTFISGVTWVGSSLVLSTGSNGYSMGASDVSLSGALDRVRLTTVNGTDTFDAGSVNIMYEG